MEMTPVVTLFEAALQESYFAITGRGRYVVYEQAHLRPVISLSLSYVSNGTTYLLYFEEPRPSVEVIEKCKSKLTHLSLV